MHLIFQIFTVPHVPQSFFSKTQPNLPIAVSLVSTLLCMDKPVEALIAHTDLLSY